MSYEHVQSKQNLNIRSHESTYPVSSHCFAVHPVTTIMYDQLIQRFRTAVLEHVLYRKPVSQFNIKIFQNRTRREL